MAHKEFAKEVERDKIEAIALNIAPSLKNIMDALDEISESSTVFICGCGASLDIGNTGWEIRVSKNGTVEIGYRYSEKIIKQGSENGEIGKGE